METDALLLVQSRLSQTVMVMDQVHVLFFVEMAMLIINLSFLHFLCSQLTLKNAMKELEDLTPLDALMTAR